MDADGFGVILCTVVALGCMSIGFALAAASLRANRDDDDEHGSRAGQDATDESSTTTLI